jgi:D-alanyl-D-alanine carboxypeptidase
MKPKLAAALLLLTASAVAQSDRQLGDRIQQIINRPEYKHSRWGMEFYSLDDKQVLFSMNSDQLFLPGSTGKLYPQATGLATFGPDYRFHTKLFRTGPVVNGALKGDLVLVASGDPNLNLESWDLH